MQSSAPATNPIRETLGAIRRVVFGWRLGIGVLTILLARLFFQPAEAPPWTLGRALFCLVILAGMLLRIWGGGRAGYHTRSKEIQAPALITGGPFAYVRNPIYLGNLILGAGMVGFLGYPSLFVPYAISMVVLYVSIIPAEEQFLRRKFGKEYERYEKAVPQLIPRLRPFSPRPTQRFNWAILRGEAGIFAILVASYFLYR